MNSVKSCRGVFCQTCPEQIRFSSGVNPIKIFSLQKDEISLKFPDGALYLIKIKVQLHDLKLNDPQRTLIP